MPSWSTMSKIGGGALEFAGGMVGKPVSTGGAPAAAGAEGAAPAGGASSWAKSAGELAGGMFGTGAGKTESMSAMAG